MAGLPQPLPEGTSCLPARDPRAADPGSDRELGQGVGPVLRGPEAGHRPDPNGLSADDRPAPELIRGAGRLHRSRWCHPHGVEKAFGSEAEHALAVMQCENPGLDPTAIHHDGDGSSDWGLFQINIVYNRGVFDYAEHLLDPWYNIAVAANVYRSRGWGDWTCGRILGLA